MRKLKLTIGLLLLTLALAACMSAADRSRARLASGDYVGAIEQLAPALTRKPNDKDALLVFNEIYPSYPESLLAAVPNLRAGASRDPAVADRLVDSFQQLLRIQRSVIGMPPTIGDNRLGLTQVRKYADNFTAELAAARQVAAQAWYDQAGNTFPGTNSQEKENLIRHYVAAENHVPNFRDSRERLARLAYDIASDYETKGTIPDLRKAVEWLEYVQAWVPNYRDAAGRLQMLAFRLGTFLKAERTVPSYREAYEYFKLAGNYDNASAEVQVFEFYDRITQLSNQATAASGARLTTASGNPSNRVTTGGVSRDPANPFVRRTAIQAETSAFSIFDPSADVVYIGAVIDGNSVADQSFRPILANRAPLDITIDLTSIRGSPTATIADPTRYSNAQQAVRSIISQGVSAAIPARMQFRMVEVKSQDHLDLALGVGIGRGDVGLRPQTGFSDSNGLSRTLVEMTQIYYTINIDIPNTAAAFFGTVGSNIVSAGLLNQTAPYYVSQVSYGRRAYFLIESTESSQAIQEQLDAAKATAERNPFGAALSVSSGMRGSFDRSRTSITSYILGGSGRSANITDLDGLLQWIVDGMDASANLGGALPIGFVLRSMKDNAIAVVSRVGAISAPAPVRIVISPIAYQIDNGNNPQTLLRLYLSGGQWQPQNPAVDPDTVVDAYGWHVALNNGDNFIPVGNANLGQRWPLEGARPYTAIVGTMTDRLYIGGKLGDRVVTAEPGRTIGNTWAGYQVINLSAEDIIRQTPAYLRLMQEGLFFRGPDFSGRIFFAFAVELVD